MSNRQVPARFLGLSRQLNHAKRSQQSVVTEYDEPLAGVQVRQRGRNSQAGKAVTGVDLTDILSSAAHGYSIGNGVRFTGLNGGANIVQGTVYYIIAANFGAGQFQISATSGGAAFNLGSDIVAGFVHRVEAAMIGAHNVPPSAETPDERNLSTTPGIPGPRQ